MTDTLCVTVITLCRNNPRQLLTTLESLPSAVVNLSMDWELLVIDGSDGPACAIAAGEMAEKLRLPLRYEWRPAQGIYMAMNEALSMVRGTLLAYMHAGDRYLPSGLTALVDHWLMLGKEGNQIAAVFGQARIQVDSESPLTWLTPSASVRNLNCWLRMMVPCHQAFLFESGFAHAHPYGTSSLVADRAVMRAAFKAVGPRAYLRQPVCVYDLSGASSALPSWKELVHRLRDRQRSCPERCAEIIKALLRPWLAPSYPHLMLWKAKLWGWLCR